MLEHLNGLEVQGLVGDQPKDTKAQVLGKKYPKVFYLLDAAPLFAFSESGLANICKRFGVSRETLEDCINTYLRPGESPDRDEHMAQDVARLLTVTPELLDTIAKAVGPKTRPRKKVAARTRSSKAKEGRKNG
ncbi:hypothetical protein CDA63_09005 [Hymenobacter amundsenii]|uniref:Uncharacterized protein n=1 Tax=Hymenobacter amundsenii TaxID=2006685 RepID=A0A246FP18_9BACT|nr:hypothetical protein [Hymenobacter amundsenii]OWP63504.1 hypothetical protein CDA63_09005 [Hymenobacter amundsenii]